jgi:hypothetical protein
VLDALQRVLLRVADVALRTLAAVVGDPEDVGKAAPVAGDAHDGR